MNDAILEDLKGIIFDKFRITSDRIGRDTQLMNGDLGLSSLQLLEFVVAVEKFYKKKFPRKMLRNENFENINVVTKMITEFMEVGSEVS